MSDSSFVFWASSAKTDEAHSKWQHLLQWYLWVYHKTQPFMLEKNLFGVFSFSAILLVIIFTRAKANKQKKKGDYFIFHRILYCFLGSILIY
jgi:hypothetical protein